MTGYESIGSRAEGERGRGGEGEVRDDCELRISDCGFGAGHSIRNPQSAIRNPSRPLSASTPLPQFRPRLKRRRVVGRLFSAFCLLMTFVGMFVLVLLMWGVLRDGASWLSLRFLRNSPSMRDPGASGVHAALWGSVWLIGLTGLFSVPVGVASAVYLQEYARDNRLTRFIQLNIANLAGVPSIVYGILGLAMFVRAVRLGNSVLAGSLTLSLLVLPVIIIASREAIAAVPNSIRQAAFALGATRWQVVRHHVLPAAMPSVMTGVILALSRAIGEAAPLVMIGALTYVRNAPRGPLDEFAALPLQIYNWSSQPQAEFHHLAAAGIIVLMAVLLCMNAVAILIRNRHQGTAAWGI